MVNFKGQNDTGKPCLCYVPQRQPDNNKLLYLLLRFLAMQNIQFYWQGSIQVATCSSCILMPIFCFCFPQLFSLLVKQICVPLCIQFVSLRKFDKLKTWLISFLNYVLFVCLFVFHFFFAVGQFHSKTVIIQTQSPTYKWKCFNQFLFGVKNYVNIKFKANTCNWWDK